MSGTEEESTTNRKSRYAVCGAVMVGRVLDVQYLLSPEREALRPLPTLPLCVTSWCSLDQEKDMCIAKKYNLRKPLTKEHRVKASKHSL